MMTFKSGKMSICDFAYLLVATWQRLCIKQVTVNPMFYKLLAEAFKKAVRDRRFPPGTIPDFFMVFDPARGGSKSGMDIIQCIIDAGYAKRQAGSSNHLILTITNDQAASYLDRVVMKLYDPIREIARSSLLKT